MSRKAVLVLLSFCLIVMLSLSVFAATRKITVSGISGEVLLRKAGSEDWVAASEGIDLFEGDSIKTKSKSSAILKFDDGSMTKIGSLTVLNLSKLFIEGKSKSTMIDVEIGKTWLRVKKISADDSFSVRTPSAIAGVRGTFFSSEVEETASTFDVFEGEVEVSQRDNPTAKVTLKQNERSKVEINKAPTAPTVIPKQDSDTLKNEFSVEEYNAYKYSIEMDISPETIEAGGKSDVTIKVLYDGKPLNRSMEIKVKLGGKAVFAGTDINEITVSTDDQGVARLQVTDVIAERIPIDVSMVVKIAK